MPKVSPRELKEGYFGCLLAKISGKSMAGKALKLPQAILSLVEEDVESNKS
jgi:hypothetical protein